MTFPILQMGKLRYRGPQNYQEIEQDLNSSPLDQTSCPNSEASLITSSFAPQDPWINSYRPTPTSTSQPHIRHLWAWAGSV